MLLLMGTFAFSTANAQKPATSPKVVPAKKVSPQKADNDTLFCSIADPMPEFPGGTAKLTEFIKTNIHYPQTCKNDSIQGRVLVRFTVEKDGSITDAKVIRSVHPDLDKEALRVVNLMPKWKPGTQNGKPVRVHYVIPFKFSL